MQFEEAGEDGDCKVEVDSAADSRKKLDLRKRVITKQLRKIEDFTDLHEDFVEGQKGKVTAIVVAD